ncbi:hypothetical protein [Hyphomicrobium sp.]|uniref:hypothetical protein n=1 Tax=Hyphomicrobium sp. TaxID=82 RepID=UPI000FA7FE6E|nr:hypothetical protein [Hyphomicrobium sp.]RUP09411.1 MAG: hypothetical protein EKK38_08580 [Hyphomicrobium sp.]
MTGNFQPKRPGNAGTGKGGGKLTRQDRLAEELRANLKRRKAAARRQGGEGGDPPPDKNEP